MIIVDIVSHFREVFPTMGLPPEQLIQFANRFDLHRTLVFPAEGPFYPKNIPADGTSPSRPIPDLGRKHQRDIQK